MTELSPAAQQVFWAFNEAASGKPGDWHYLPAIAAELKAQPEPEGPTELIRALELAEAALADIGDAEREPGDDLAWAEARAAQVLPRIRAVLARWGK